MFLFGGMWTLDLWVKKAMGCIKSCLMGHTTRNMKGSGGEDDFNCRGLAHMIQRRRMLVCGLETNLGKECGCFFFLSEKSL